VITSNIAAILMVTGALTATMLAQKVDALVPIVHDHQGHLANTHRTLSIGIEHKRPLLEALDTLNRAMGHITQFMAQLTRSVFAVVAMPRALKRVWQHS
jgi:hypothetical protein